MAVMKPDVKRYLVDGDPDGPVLKLRGHGALFARITILIGLGLMGLAVVATYGVIEKPTDEVSTSIAIMSWLMGPALFFGAIRRLRKPDRFLIVDKNAKTLQVTSYNRTHDPIPFSQLGTMALGSSMIGVHGSGGGRRKTYVQVVHLTNHPEVILYYDPPTNRDMVRFVTTLRHVVGEQYLPRAEKSPRAS